MNSLRSKKGLSLIELVSITGIIVLILVIAFMAVQFYCDGVARGNDKMSYETASSIARTNRADGYCVVTGCTGGKECSHKTPEGSYIGYYNRVTSHIDGAPGDGYNEYKKMTIGEKVYEGKRNTMVLKIESKDSKMKLSWVKADAES